MSEKFWSSGQPFSGLAGGAAGGGGAKFWWQGQTLLPLTPGALPAYSPPVLRKPWWLGVPFAGLNSGVDTGGENLWWQGRPGVPLIPVITPPVLTGADDWLFEAMG